MVTPVYGTVVRPVAVRGRIAVGSAVVAGRDNDGSVATRLRFRLTNERKAQQEGTDKEHPFHETFDVKSRPVIRNL